MKIFLNVAFLLGMSLFGFGCNDTDLVNDEAGEAGASGVASPTTEKHSTADGQAGEFDDSTPPPGSGDASGQIGSGVEADGGGATGITEGADLSDQDTGSTSEEAPPTDGSDPGDS